MSDSAVSSSPASAPESAVNVAVARGAEHLERRAIALLFLTLALIVGAAAYLMYARGVFEPTQTLVLMADDSEGVVVGMDMTFSGFPIGRVSKLELAPDGNVRIYVSVPRKDAHWLRESSVFTLVKGIVGATTIKAYSGILDDPPLLPDAVRPVLRGDATSDVPQIMATAKELLGNLNQLTSPDAALGQTLQQLRILGEKLNGNHGAMEVLLGSPANARKVLDMLDRTNQLLERMDRMVVQADQQVFEAGGLMPQVKGTVSQVNELLAQTRQSLQKMDVILTNTEGITSNVQTASQDLGALRADVESNLRKVESMMTDLQRKWPFAKDAEVKLP